MAKLILSNTSDKSGITRTFTSQDADTTNDSSLKVKWKTAIVVSGTWLLYSETQYNDNIQDSGKSDNKQDSGKSDDKQDSGKSDDKPDSGKSDNKPKMAIVNEHSRSTEVELELTFQPKSVRPLPVVQNNIVLFEHPNYGGTMQKYSAAVKNLSLFPVHNQAGLSSCFIKGKHWEFFSGPDYRGHRLGELYDGYHPDFSGVFPGIDANDVVMSIRPI